MAITMAMVRQQRGQQRRQRQWWWQLQLRQRRWQRQRQQRRCKSWCSLLALMFCFLVVDMLYIIVIQLPLAFGSGVKIVFKFFYYMRWEPVPMFFEVFASDVLVKLLKWDLRTFLGTNSTIVPRGDVLLNNFDTWNPAQRMNSKSSAGSISSRTVSSVLLSLFSKPTTTTIKNHYITCPSWQRQRRARPPAMSLQSRRHPPVSCL